jgi:hypothetical protein
MVEGTVFWAVMPCSPVDVASILKEQCTRTFNFHVEVTFLGIAGMLSTIFRRHALSIVIAVRTTNLT